MRAGVRVMWLALATAACGEPASAPSADGATADSGGAGCSTCADRVCAADPACCGEGWSHACVLEAAIGCDETCEPTGEPIVHPQLRADGRQHGPDPASASHTVTPVIFVPADLAGDPLVAATGRLFAEMAREGQGLYWHATGGQTFALAPLETVIGARDNAAYGSDSGPVRAEVTAAIGRANDGAHDTWILWIGGSGQAGAYAEADWNPAISFTALIGEGSIYSHLAHVTGDPAWCGHIVEASFRAECEEEAWIITAGMGATLHELGHTFGLGHEDDHGGDVPPDSFMSAHWNYFNVRSPDGAAGALSQVYKDRLRASPFFAGGR